MENHFMPVNQLLYRAIAAGDGLPELNREQEETVVAHSGQLSFRFMREAIRHAGARALGALVHAAQGTTYTLMNYLHRRELKEGSSHLRSRLGKSLCAFMEYLRKDFAGYFRHEDPMPMLLWFPVLERLRAAFSAGEACILPGSDPALMQVLKEELEHQCDNVTPSYRTGDYWQLLADKLGHTTAYGDDPTLRAIYTLITWNFNSGSFVQYLVGRYLAAIPEEAHALPHWKDNLRMLNRIADMPQHGLHKGIATCKQMLTDTIQSEINACEFVQEGQRLIAGRQKVSLSISVAQMGVLLRAMCDTGFVATSNARILTRLFAEHFSSERSGAISPESLNNKFYSLERAAVLMMESRLVELLNQCKKYRSEAK
jgi:hypothetical protein